MATTPPQTIINTGADAGLSVYAETASNIPPLVGNASIYITNTTEQVTNVINNDVAGGESYQVQYNLNDRLQGDSGFTYNPSTDSVAVAGNLAANAILTDNLKYANGANWAFGPGSYGNSNVAAYLPTYTGNISGNVAVFTEVSGNGAGLTTLTGSYVVGAVSLATSAESANTANTATTATTAGTVTNGAQGNITSVGTLQGLTVNGTATSTLFEGSGANLTNLNGANVTGTVGSATTATTAGSANSASFANTVLDGAQPNITSVGTLVSLNSTGNITASHFIGNGSTLTSLTGANITGTVANANYAAYAGNVTNAVQANITSIGILDGLTVNGNTGIGSNGILTVSNSQPSTNTTNGALRVVGGISSQSNIHGVHIHSTSNIYSQGTLYAGADSIAQGVLTNPVIIAKTTGATYVQAAIINSDSNGSSDWIAYSDAYPGVSDDHGWMDMGMAGSSFSDPSYTITKPEDGYIFASAVNGGGKGGNLVIATDSTGSHNDIVFGAGGFLASDEKFRYVHNTNTLVPYANATMDLGNSTNHFGNVYGNYFIGDGSLLTGVTATAAPSSNIVNGVSTVDIATANGNVNVTANTYSYIFDDTGILTIPGVISGTSAMWLDNNLTNSDIQIQSGDDIILQGKDRILGDTSEGGDINIYAGDGAADDGIAGSGSGGDFRFYAGDGGAANVVNAGDGGTVRLRGGPGGTASASATAGVGGYVEIQAGSAGDNGGNTLLGSTPGYVSIQSGASTLEAANGGAITLATGTGGANASAGLVEIIIPASTNGPGGVWTFTGQGNILQLPQNAEIYSPSIGNVTVGSLGNTFIRSVDSGNIIPYTWGFTDTGNFELADGNSFIKSVPNSAGDSSGLSTLQLYPDKTTNDDRYLIVDPTGPNHIHIRAGGVQDASNTLLYLGGEQTFVQIDDGYHRVSINSYDVGNTVGYNWRFDYNGNFVLPNNTVAINFANGTPAFGNVSGVNFDSNASNVLYGNGVFAAAPGGSSYSNSDVSTFLASFGSNTISTTGNVTTGNVIANGIDSNIIRRAFGLVAADTTVTLDDLQVSVTSSTNQLNLQLTSGSWQGTGWTETYTSGSIAVSNWVNLPLSSGFSTASGAMSNQGSGCRCVIGDQTPNPKMYQITVNRLGTSGSQWGISIERLI
jgi:hypothetical protein